MRSRATAAAALMRGAAAAALMGAAALTAAMFMMVIRGKRGRCGQQHQGRGGNEKFFHGGFLFLKRSFGITIGAPGGCIASGAV